MPRLAPPGVLASALLCALTLALPAAGGRTTLVSNQHKPSTVLLYGDSLAVGTELFLARYLRGWRVQSSTEVSAHAADAPGALRAYGSSLPRVVVLSLGTNDDPAMVASFSRVVRRAVAVAGPTRCVVWATIARPPYEGVSYAGYNEALRAVARRTPNLLVLDWAAMANGHRAWFGPDGVHPSMSGYRARAAAVARLVRSC